MFAHPKGLEPSCKRGVITWCLLASGFVLLMPAFARADEAAAEEEARPARPPPPPPLEPTKLPETRHVDIGAGVAFVQRVAEGQTLTNVSYPAAVGVGLSARVDVWRYLRASLYVVRASKATDLEPNSLGLEAGNPGEVVFTTYSFGLRLSPMLPLGPRARVWATFGAGWGRLEAGRFDGVQGSYAYKARERAFSFVEFPLGLGYSVDIIKNWLALELEVTAAPHAAQRGTARENGQIIVNGMRSKIEPFPGLSVTFVETIGLALIL